ncbi:GMC oxidoreductase [Neolewinella antarctica]|uniref:Choline dehydrogenase-like flavoprotein n=1 Tax=Neolewinella antarctica TaxID=442734 RepID=A0ABX0XE27_9BACT|nr:GMC family oxidoreductase [Neolewinella antarctica]NJC27564.1 choline dehydrogenase-like flavoprotein [Neolewinella antarctica]
MKFNSQGADQVTYDAIVVGTGISGGWAAKELTEKGLKTLVLEKGRMVKHGVDYETANLDDWDLPHHNKVPQEEIDKHYFKQNRTGYTVRQAHKKWFVKDDEHPYDDEKARFDWMRGYHVGGRSLMWGRHSYRWSQMDFEANARDGHGTPWPVGYDDIAPWYDYVETFAGISGELRGLSQLPDGKFLPAMPLNCAEDHFKKGVEKNLGWNVTPGRVAHLTSYNPDVHKGTRGACQYRNRCIRGCPYGGYFSSVSSTIPVAEATGNLTLRPNSSVYSLIMDKDAGKAKGVRARDTETGEELEFYAKVVFLCASAIPSAYIVMNTEHEEEMTMDASGELGGNIMDHHFRVGANGTLDEYGDKYYKGRKPNGFYIPRYQNLGDRKSQSKDFVRGWGYQGGGDRSNWMRAVREMDTKIGPGLKQALVQPGPWHVGMTAFAETLPYTDNRMTINRDALDKDGLPTLSFDASWKENEYAMVERMKNDAAEMLEAAGFKNVSTYDAHSFPGLGIHEMGMARMGSSKRNSVVDKHNRLWTAPNVYMTDGAFMTSAACVNPSLTYMAFTARAAEHAVGELKKMNI